MPVEGTKSFDVAAVEAGISHLRFAGRVRHYAVAESTNELAIRAARAGARESVWVADEQTAGRGRGGHTWHSVAGDGLYLSALVLPHMPMSYAAELPMATALAVQAGVREATGMTLDLRWPNDLMLGDRKCGGILVESASMESAVAGPMQPAGQLRYAVIGIGLNLNHAVFPAELAGIATSLYLHGGRSFEREPVVISILEHIEEEVSDLLRNSRGAHNSRPPVRARFASGSTWVTGKRVRVEEDGGYTGWTRGLDRDGFLQVEDEEGVMRTVKSGGVRALQPETTTRTEAGPPLREG